MRLGPVSAAIAALGIAAVAACDGSAAPPSPSLSSAVSPRGGGSANAGTTAVPAPPSGATQGTGPGGCTLPAPASSAGGMTLSVCFGMSGEVSASGGFLDQGADPAALSCADWAENGGQPPGASGGVLFLPDPGDAQITVRGQGVGFFLEIGGYHGPGGYGASGLVESATYGTATSWSTNSDASAIFSARVDADGSGTASASDLRPDAGGGGQESVTESWTCAMEPGA